MVRLEDLIPDPSTREFLREVNRHWGRDWANTLTRAMVEGVLADMGSVERFAQSVENVDKRVDGEQLELVGCHQNKSLQRP